MIRAAVAILALLALAPLGAQAPEPGRRVAITLDDGPAVDDLRAPLPMLDLGTYQRITSGLIDAFEAEMVPVTVFINEAQINVPGERDARAAALDQWLDAGFELANHTYSHASANQITLEQYVDEIVKGEVVMRPLLERRGQTLTWFRYPFLHAGPNAEHHGAILSFLASRGYRAAPVTTDYADYTFARARARALLKGDTESAERIRRAYVEQVDAGFEYAEKASTELFGREIPQILLIHCNELNAITMRETIDRMRQRGYRFITLDEAMSDPVYDRPDVFTGPGGSWFVRTAAAMGVRIESVTRPRVPEWIATLGAD